MGVANSCHRRNILTGCAGMQDHHTPLQCAAEKGHQHVVKLLLDHGADPDYHRQLVSEMGEQRGTRTRASLFSRHRELCRLILPYYLPQSLDTMTSSNYCLIMAHASAQV